jgi:hypothetical protein
VTVASPNSYINGQIMSVIAQIKDRNGQLADASTVTITWTRPDATTTAPAVTHDATGIYHADVTLNQVGTWSYASVSTGNVSVGGPVTFTVA